MKGGGRNWAAGARWVARPAAMRDLSSATRADGLGRPIAGSVGPAIAVRAGTAGDPLLEVAAGIGPRGCDPHETRRSGRAALDQDRMRSTGAHLPPHEDPRAAT